MRSQSDPCMMSIFGTRPTQLLSHEPARRPRMADVNVSLDSSDLPVIIEALEFRNAALRRTASEKREIEQRPLVEQIKLLINTFKSIQS